MRRFILPIACAFTLVTPKAGGQIPVVKDTRVISFEENKVPDNWKGAGLAINTAHYKDGKQSMQWTFKPEEIPYWQRPLSVYFHRLVLQYQRYTRQYPRRLL